MLVLPGGNHPSPDKITPSMYDITEGGRDATGKMHLDKIATKYKIQVEYGVLTSDEVKRILTSIKPLFFNITFDDPESGTTKTIEVYKGDRTIPTLFKDTSGKIYYKGLSFNLVER